MLLLLGIINVYESHEHELFIHMPKQNVYESHEHSNELYFSLNF